MAQKSNSYTIPLLIGFLSLVGLVFYKRGIAQVGAPTSGDQIDWDNFSQHFSYNDIVASQTADDLGIDNSPTQEAIFNAYYLAQKVLDPVANWLGAVPSINSWYRSAALNAQVGGTSTSDHLTGAAADLELYVNGQERNELIARAVLAASIPFDQMIIYDNLDQPSRVHLSYDQQLPGNEQRQQILFKNSAGNYEAISLASAQSFYL